MFVEKGLTILTLVGTGLFYWQEISNLLVKIKMRMMSMNRHDDIDEAKENLYYSSLGLNQGIRKLIKIVLGLDGNLYIYCFYFISILIPMVVGAVTIRITPVFLRVILISVAASLPTLFLLGKLQTLRVKNSKEGKRLIMELLDNYKIHYYNMQRAVEITASVIDEAPNCKRLLFNLSKGLNRASTDDEIRTLIEEFRYAIGTSWSGVLADNIYFALSSGVRVENAMEDLVNTIVMAEEVEEKTKRENNEAGLVLKYLVPLCYLLSFVGGIKFFGLTTGEFLYYQFGTQAGITWFSAIIVMYIISLVAKFFLTQNKLDL